ncbi:hypothetical protein Hanom_Chr06g00507311 [Helianthus anomalus]
MDSICCCQCDDDFEEFPTNAIYRHCICLRFFFHQLFTGVSTRFILFMLVVLHNGDYWIKR